MPGIQITCPTCGHAADESEFAVSCGDECFCPNGCEWFILEMDDEETITEANQ